MPDYHLWDIETYPNVFTCAIGPADNNKVYTFEVSDRRDDRELFKEYCLSIYDKSGYMVGYNSLPFDYPVIHDLFKNSKDWDWYSKAQKCIDAENEWDVIVRNTVVNQIDLRKVWHFDNVARMQSLKGLEFALGMDSIEDLPYEPGKRLTHSEIDELRRYNRHDWKATKTLFMRSKEALEFRHKIGEEYERDFLNSSDVKIGTNVLIIEAERHTEGCCYDPVTRQKKQTKRASITISDILLPSISFKRGEFKGIHEFFKNLIVTDTKGAFKETLEVDGFTFHYGLGGLHGSVSSQAIHSDDDFLIVDVDVASYYPNLAIVNDIYPEHLSSKFCEVYKSIYERRAQHAKGTPENAMLKLALNGAYGNSNNPYSPLYDPQYTMAITINGQLLLTMLSEQFMATQGISMIQANTDGVTVLCHRDSKDDLDRICKWWMDLTGLVLEEVQYKSMFIRDVNNYIAVGTDGYVKRKGAYEWDYELHQDPSSTVVAKAAESFLVHGTPVEEFINNHTDPHAFTIRSKMTGDNKCLYNGVAQQKVTRYHMANSGHSLTKWMPADGPKGTYKRKNKLTDSYYESILKDVGDQWDERIHTKNKSVYDDRENVISGGGPVVICNNMKDFNWTRLDYQYYIDETNKLVEVFE